MPYPTEITQEMLPRFADISDEQYEVPFGMSVNNVEVV